MSPVPSVLRPTPPLAASNRCGRRRAAVGRAGRAIVGLTLACTLVLSPRPAAHAGGAGLVAAAHPVAAAAGAEVLAQGGSAVDAAIAASAALGVAEPFGSGLGGGGFLLAFDAATGGTTAIDCRETAPAAATVDLLIDPATGKPFARETLASGGLTVGAPGLVRCWEEASRRWGRLPLGQVLAPAIRAARDGFEVTPYFNGEIAAARRRLAQFPASAALYLPGGEPLPVGTRFRQPDLATTLQLVADRGADGFYAALAPEIAKAAAAPATVDAPTIALQPGRLTAADVVAYRARVLEPVRGAYRGLTVVTQPAPASGPTLVETLNLLDGFDLASLDGDSTATVHLVAEAQRVANADRTRWLGDPAVAPVPCAALVSPAFADTRRALIDPAGVPTSPTRAGDPDRVGDGGCGVGAVPALAGGLDDAGGTEPIDVDETGTTHLSVVDADGNAVALTQTLALHFGSGITVPGRGFLLNDTLVNFRSDPAAGASNNLPGPGKRPRSSIAPTMLFDPAGRLRFVLGVAGSEWITPVAAQLTVDLVDHGLTPQAAVDRGRFIPGDSRGAVALEGPYFDAHADLVAGLQRLGHRVSRVSGERAAAQVIARDPDSGQLDGGADRRRDGAVDAGED